MTTLQYKNDTKRVSDHRLSNFDRSALVTLISYFFGVYGLCQTW